MSIFNDGNRHTSTNSKNYEILLIGLIFQLKMNNCFGISMETDSLASWVECLPMVRETGFQSRFESYQRLKKMVLDTSLLNTQHYKVRIKGKEEQSKEMISALPDTSVLKQLKREPSSHPRLRSLTLLTFTYFN